MAPTPRPTVRPHRLSRLGRRSHCLLHPLVAALALAMPLQSPAQVPVPVPPPAVKLPEVSTRAGWRVHGQGPRSAPEISNDGRHMRIQQDSARAIYNWASFDIGAESSVTFDMAKAGASALNRVDGTAPSQIFGKLSATNGGEVLIYNRNGILFGRGASVDVGNLIATALKPRDEDYTSGFVANITGSTPAFRFDGAASDFIESKNFVRVDAGAEIKTAEGGRIFLFARDVKNAGTLSAPGGQVVLGAGAEVYYKLPTAEPLYAAENNKDVPALRGLLVEVGRHTLGSEGDGKVRNDVTGVINTPRGNTTLVGMAVNQSGRISASTSVAQNGSVLLLAQGGVVQAFETSNAFYKRARVSGDLVLDAGSRIEITAADQGADGKALSADDNAGFVNSRLDLAGKTITLARGASIVAPAAQASLRALATPDYRADLLVKEVFTPEGGRIQIDAGASIDLSGTRNTELSVARHFVTTELLGSNDLKDAPLQKDGLLYRNKVTLDTRQDSLILGSLDSYRRSLQRSASERMAHGGSLKLLAGGAVLAHAESRLAVDGGLLRYLDAEVRPTQLFSASGKGYSLNNAPGELLYTAISNAGTNKARYDRWGPMVNYGTVLPARQEAGYTEGGRGGSLAVVAPEVLLDGALSGQTTLGRRQRIGLDALPAGASLGIGAARHKEDFGANAYAGAVLKDFRIGNDVTPLDEAQWLRLRGDSEAALGRSSGLAASRLLGAGFQHIEIAAEGPISSTAALELPALGSLQLLSRGGRVSVDADIRSASGSLSLRSFKNEVAVAAGVKLDVAGQWSNAALDPEAAALTLKGGTLLLSGDTGLSLGAASRLDVSGGALLAGANRLALLDGAGRLKANGLDGCKADQACGGAAGSITLSTGSSTFTNDVAARRLQLGGELRGYSMSQGGHLSLTAPGLRIADRNNDAATAAAPGTLELAPEFFGQGGFGRFSLDGRQALALTAGTRLAPTQQLWHAEAAARKAPSGSAMDALMTLAAPRQGLPKAIELSLASSGLGGNRPEGRLSVAEGASIALEPGAKLSLSAATALAMDGELRAPGGQLSLAVKASNSGEGDIPHYLWLGAKSRIDVAGQRQLQASTDGLPQGRLLGGGSVSLSASGDGAFGTSLVWQRGAVIDISGASGALLSKEQSQGGSEQRIRQLASSAGSLSISGNQDIVLEGSLRAQAGGAGQGGGTLSLSLVPGFVTPILQGLPALRRLELVGGEERRSDALRAEALPAPTGLSGRASLSTALLQGSGLAELNLSAQEGIAIADGVNLDLARGLKLDTPVLLMQDRAQARLAAPLLQWHNTQPVVSPANSNDVRPLPTALAGQAGLSLAAGELMMLGGKLVTQGMGRLNLSSGGDLRLQGTASPGGYQGSLATAADTRLTARQLFPASDTLFSIDAGSQLLEFASSPGAAPALPWSAGGSLKLKAADIVQGGRLRAPAGLIEFQATGQLSLSAGSETSVSAAGRELLFGTWSGERWVSPGSSTGAVLGAAPAKAIVLNAAAVDVAPGALLDLSGGGKLSAWQFVAGPGGSRDIFTGLDATGRNDGAYAIVPGVLSSGAQALAGEGAPALGRQITIGEGAPVPAGTYTLLPARYAVLDGAWLLRPAGAGATPLGLGVSVARDDGSLLLGARLGLAGSAEQEARTSTWQLLSAAQARRYSEIRLADADQFFPALAAGQDRARPALLRDAGSLVVATQQAQIRGLTRFDAGRGPKDEQGLAGSAYFGAERIQIGGPARAGALYLDPAQLSALGAQHLVIGAIPKSLATPEQLELRSNTLELAPGAEPLKAQSLLLAAAERLTLGQGARLEAAPVDAQAPSRQWQLQGDGAALLVSGDAEAGLLRSGAQRQRGDLSIGAGSVLSAAGGSLLLDATGRSTLAADAKLQADSIALGVSRLQIGGSAALQDDNTLLSAELLAQLGGAERLLLRSYAGFDFLAGASLGAPGLARLSLDGPGLRVLGEGLASVSAARIDIGNSTGLSAGDAPAAGRLRLAASGSGAGQGEIHLQDGSQRWQLGGAELRAERALLFSGRSQLSLDGADLQVFTPVLKAARPEGKTGSAELDWRIGGALSLQTTASAATGAADAVAAARVSLTAQRLDIDTTLDLPAAQLALRATGADADLVFGSQARVSVAGRSDKIGNTLRADIAAGRLSAVSERGDLRLLDGGQLDVSAAGDGDAGSLSLVAAEGALRLQGRLLAAAASAERGASLQLDSRDALDLAGLAGLIAQAGPQAFTHSIEVRNRQGDQQLAAGTSLRAAALTLSSDAGSLSVAGRLDASAAQGGEIRLNARGDLLLADGAQLLARSQQADGAGKVWLNSDQGNLNLQAGSLIDLSGPGAAPAAGLVQLRAARQGQDVRIAAIDAGLRGVARVDVEAVKVYTGVNELVDGLTPVPTPTPPTPTPPTPPTPTPPTPPTPTPPTPTPPTPTPPTPTPTPTPPTPPTPTPPTPTPPTPTPPTPTPPTPPTPTPTEPSPGDGDTTPTKPPPKPPTGEPKPPTPTPTEPSAGNGDTSPVKPPPKPPLPLGVSGLAKAAGLVRTADLSGGPSTGNGDTTGTTPPPAPPTGTTPAPGPGPGPGPTPPPGPAPTPTPAGKPLGLERVLVDNAEFMGERQQTAEAITARLSRGQAAVQDLLRVRAGVEVRAEGDLTVSKSWQMPVLTKAQAQRAPHAAEAALTLRAAGNLLLKSGLATGFRPSPNDETQLIGTSVLAGDIRLVAGADLASADLRAVLGLERLAEDKGSVLIGADRRPGQSVAPEVALRSTVGSLELMAGRDIRLLNGSAKLYTTGTPVGVVADAEPPIDDGSVEALGQAGSRRASLLMRAAAADQPSPGNGDDTTGTTPPPGAPTKPGEKPPTPPTPIPPPTPPTPDPEPGPDPEEPGGPDPVPTTIHTPALDALANDLDGSGMSPFTSGGGRITLKAGRDVVGVANNTDQRSVSDWLWRASASEMPIAWFSRVDRFAQGIASFGGGDIAVQAGRDLHQLHAAAASSGLVMAPATADAAAAGGRRADSGSNGLAVFGGGALRASAGRDLVSGQLMATKGRLDVRAGGAIRNEAEANVNFDPGLQLVFQDAAVRVQAGQDLQLASVRNLAHAFAAAANTLGRNLSLPGLDARASLLLQSAAGSIAYAGAEQATRDGEAIPSDRMSAVLPIDLRLLAPQGSIQANNIRQWSDSADPAAARTWLGAGESLTLSHIELLALGNAPLPFGLRPSAPFMDAQRLGVIDADGQLRPDQSPREPAQFVAQRGDLLISTAMHSARPLEFRAGRDLRVDGSLTVQHQSPAEGRPQEQTLLRAGRDIRFGNGGVDLAGPGQLLLLAGRDVDLGPGTGLVARGNLSNSVLLPEQGAGITVLAGLADSGEDYAQAVRQGFHVLSVSDLQGRLGQTYGLLGGATPGFERLAPAAQIEALRELLGSAKVDGWLAAHLRALPARPEAGEQRLRVAALLGKPAGDAAVDEALKSYADSRQPAWSALTPAQALPLLAQLGSEQQSLAVLRLMLAGLAAQPAPARAASLAALSDAKQLEALAAYVKSASGATVSPGQAAAAFEGLSVERQIPWLNRQLVDELRRSGRAASQLDGDARWARYGPAYLAIDLLFPGERPAGRLRMPTSQIKTLQAADITVLVPGGGANAGDIAGQTGFKKASDLGIVTVSGGDISAVVRDDFEVNASRVFTLGQGDLLMWSSAGNIDAGRGAKTVTGAPPPVLRLLENGSLVLDASGSFSGSGIAVLGAGSDLDLYAPTGEINAGEAGIRSKGNAFLGAERLVNANDINVAGSRSGTVAEAPLSVPITVPVNDALTPTAASGGESAREDDERKRRRTRRNLLLEFLGFGNS